MKVVLTQWVGDRLRNGQDRGQDVNRLVALMASRIEWAGVATVEQFFAMAQASSDNLLDAIDLLLKTTRDPGQWSGPPGANNKALEAALSISGSLWTVNPGGDGLVERIDSTALDQAKAAADVQDNARDDLVEAWNRAYGRDADASDAWDHAIKAAPSITPSRSASQPPGI